MKHRIMVLVITTKTINLAHCSRTSQMSSVAHCRIVRVISSFTWRKDFPFNLSVSTKLAPPTQMSARHVLNLGRAQTRPRAQHFHLPREAWQCHLLQRVQTTNAVSIAAECAHNKSRPSQQHQCFDASSALATPQNRPTRMMQPWKNKSFRALC